MALLEFKEKDYYMFASAIFELRKKQQNLPRFKTRLTAFQKL